MPLFLTHVANDESIVMDREGQDYPSATAAITEAQRAALAIVAQEWNDGKLAPGIKLFVENEFGSRVATISVIAAIDLR